jgi:hypothetical protein
MVQLRNWCMQTVISFYKRQNTRRHRNRKLNLFLKQEVGFLCDLAGGLKEKTEAVVNN